MSDFRNPKMPWGEMVLLFLIAMVAVGTFLWVILN